MPDVTVYNGGSIVMFTPHTEQAKSWVADNVPLESWQWMGPSFAVEARFAPSLTEYMMDDMLKLEWG